MTASLGRRLAAEFLGTAFLLLAVVGSGIMGERLSGGNVAIALLANSIATGAALVALILTFGPVSGAHFNPAVTLYVASRGELEWSTASLYCATQTIGAFLGVLCTHVLFGLQLFSVSHHARNGGAQVFSEFVATLGLLLVIASCGRFQSSATPFAVGAYILGAYWFTSSTSFANPAVTLARSVTDTFAGVRPRDVPGFLLAQVLAAIASIFLVKWLLPSRSVQEVT
jgi:glycerol uptake facilitator-like aquaporin